MEIKKVAPQFISAAQPAAAPVQAPPAAGPLDRTSLSARQARTSAPLGRSRLTHGLAAAPPAAGEAQTAAEWLDWASTFG